MQISVRFSRLTVVFLRRILNDAKDFADAVWESLKKLVSQ
jgi:hypothetical protein